MAKIINGHFDYDKNSRIFNFDVDLVVCLMYSFIKKGK